ncbi:MAG: transporter [Eubacterium sp.]|nr:transporter [Eubacterium sp.]
MKKGKTLGKDFMLLVAGQIISLFGNAILRFSLPLYLLRATGSSALFGVVTACSFLPMIALSLLGGVLADRVNKRNIMVWLDFTAAVIVTGCYFLMGKLPLVPLLMVVLMLLYGIAGIEQPTVQASVPALVKKEQVLAAGAIVNQVGSLANFIGPILGGMLFGIWGISLILHISAISFFLSAVLELFLVIPFEKQQKPERLIKVVKDDLSESSRFIRRDKPIFLPICVIIAGLNMTLSAMLTIGIPVLLADIPGVTDQMLGITQGLLAAGGLTGGLLTVVFERRLKPEKSFVFLLLCSSCAFIMGITMILQRSVLITYVLLSSASFMVTVFSTTFSIQMLALVQTETPKHLIGKVVASIMVFIMCAQPLGQLLYGLLFEIPARSTWIVILGTSGLSFSIALYSKKIFIHLKENTSNE